jgi:hypothetical protein
MAKVVRLNASTVLEVVIAMTVVIIVITLAMAMIGNVNKGSLSVRKLKARLILENELRSKDLDRCIDRTVEANWTIKCDIRSGADSGSASVIHLQLIDENRRKLAEVEKVILIGNEN